MYSFLSLLIFAVCHGIFEMCVYTVGKKMWMERKRIGLLSHDGRVASETALVC